MEQSADISGNSAQWPWLIRSAIAWPVIDTHLDQGIAHLDAPRLAPRSADIRALPLMPFPRPSKKDAMSGLRWTRSHAHAMRRNKQSMRRIQIICKNVWVKGLPSVGAQQLLLLTWPPSVSPSFPLLLLCRHSRPAWLDGHWVQPHE